MHFGDTATEETGGLEETGRDRSPGGRLVKMALSACELIRSVEGTAYARVAIDGHRETMALDGVRFHDWLCGTYYETTGATAKADHVRQAIQVLRHQAMKRPKQAVYLRFANLGDTIYWDQGSDRWDAIEIGKDGWRLVAEAPVVFRRTPNTAALPIPVRGGSMDELRPFFGSTEEGWMLLKGAILAAAHGEGPNFVVSVHGEQGSAKSWTCRFPKRLLDPVGAAELDRLPRDEERWATTARNEYLLAFDNVSRITDDQSDTLCRLATGGGEKRRKLYTDDDQVVFDYKRPVFLNGIPDFTERPDPLDRSLSIQQPVLEAKKSEKVLETEWTKTLPRILGGVLDLLVMGLRRWDETPEAGVYRMADAVRWVTACLGDDSFERAYRENREAATEHGLACSPLAPVLMQFLDTEAPAPLGVGAGHRGQFRGTAEELLKAVLAFASAAGIGLVKSFPERPNTFSNQLRRDAALLRARGVDVRFVRIKGERIIDIQPVAAADDSQPGASHERASEAALETGPDAPEGNERGETIDFTSLPIRQRPFGIGSWVLTRLVDEPVKVLAYYPCTDEYAVGFPDGREFSRGLGERAYRVCDRPRVSVAPGEILGVVPDPLSAAG